MKGKRRIDKGEKEDKNGERGEIQINNERRVSGNEYYRKEEEKESEEERNG